MIINERGIRPPLLFVHIPKTGGTSVKIALRENGIADNWIRQTPPEKYLWGHDPFYSLQKDNNLDGAFKFSVVRNPYEWIYSFYRFIMQINLHNYKSFENFIDLLESSQNKHMSRNRQGQRYYLKDLQGNVSLDKIYKFENLGELEKDLNISLPFINKGQYHPEDFFNDYKPKNIDRIRKIFEEDFSILGYKKEFNG